MTIRNIVLAFAAVCGLAALVCPIAIRGQQKAGRATYCNPIDLPYRFQLDAPSRREAADPTLIAYRGEYWLFPSKSGGYWHSKGLLDWKFVKGSGYPVEAYAPTAVAIDGRLYLTAAGLRQLFVTDDPATGVWKLAADLGRSYGDPDLFLDDDGLLYMYDGCSGTDVLHVTELDRKNGFRALRTEAIPQSRDLAHRGWEGPGDTNRQFDKESWIEGSWVTKHDGKYYLQYSGPGTQFKTYADGVLVSEHPMGPFTYQPYSPFSFKPTGFAAGAGHSSTVEGPAHDWWHISTMTISVRHMFERRLGIFPTRFDQDGQMVADTYLGDYPHFLDGARELAGWMLLSRGKKAAASSSMPAHEPALAVDEEIRTWWSAQTGNPGEWFQLDLGAAKQIHAIQLNFADEGSTAIGPLPAGEGFGYVLASSNDGVKWTPLVDRSAGFRDAPNEYLPLAHPVSARYVRVTNVHTPAGARFSLGDLRVFGNGGGSRPATVGGVHAARDSKDARSARVSWDAVAGAGFYIVRLGNAPGKLYMNYQVYDAQELDIHSLTQGVTYYLTVDAVNENGVAKGTKTVTVQ